MQRSVSSKQEEKDVLEIYLHKTRDISLIRLDMPGGTMVEGLVQKLQVLIN